MSHRLLLALLTPLLLWISWPSIGFSPLLFVAFIPILFLEDLLKDEKAKTLFVYSWISFGTFNLLCTWWLINAHWSALATTVLVNGGLMALVMVIFRFFKNKLGSQRGYVALPFLWICLETLHKNWDLSFPWLNLGNGFATRVEWIQWYEYTGTTGGTFWVLVVNILFFLALRKFRENSVFKSLVWRVAAIVVLVVLLPIIISSNTYRNYEDKGHGVDIVLVQPNFDTYTEKPVLSDEDQAIRFIRLANAQLDSNVDFLVGPEVLLPGGLWQHDLENHTSIQLLKTSVEQYPNLSVVCGATTLKHYPDGQQSSTARPLNNNQGYVDVYNSALLLQNDKDPVLYHKSKMVAGVEMMPFASVLKPVLGTMIENMGGTAYGLATQDYPVVFPSNDKASIAAPLICYDSDFGEFVTGFVRKGANIILVITNDDWWGKTPGHIQHLYYARLRAIENRRSIARSANTGISCFINQRGDVSQATQYKEEAVLRGTLKANSEFTYYSQAGDLFSRMALFICGFMLLAAFVRAYLQRVDSKV